MDILSFSPPWDEETQISPNKEGSHWDGGNTDNTQ